VTPADLTITANDQTKAYGDTFNFGGTEFSTIGLVGFDHVSGVTLTSAGAAADAPVIGSPYYVITPSAAAGTGLANYHIHYVDGHLTVGPVPLTITASDGTMTYGGTAPIITASYSGWVNGDNDATIKTGGNTPPTCDTTATSSSPVIGSYASSCHGAIDPNYTIGYVPARSPWARRR